MIEPRRNFERRALQGVVALACLVPLSASLDGIVRGAAMFAGIPHHPVPVDLDSHFRYLSGIFLMLGVGFVSCVPAIERKGPRFRALGAMVIAGGLARGLSWLTVGAPGAGHRFGLAMELGVLPVLLLWQARVARFDPLRS